MRPQALRALRACAHIIHAGDIGDPAILDALRAVAPVSAVRGNNDRGAWARKIPASRILRIAGARIFVIHDLAGLNFNPAAKGFQVVVSGHSHRPREERRDGVLFVNPGSAGPRRFSLPVAVGKLTVSGAGLQARLLTLELR